MQKAYLLITGFFLTILCPAAAQTVNIPPDPEKWDTLGGQPVKESYLGKECLLLQKGVILFKDAELRDGIIETDISFPQQRGFPGIVFRMVDRSNSEYFYVRPHQSGNPDATQYTPVFNGNAGWQLYHGEGFSKAIAFKFDQWHHLKTPAAKRNLHFRSKRHKQQNSLPRNRRRRLRFSRSARHQATARARHSHCRWRCYSVLRRNESSRSVCR